MRKMVLIMSFNTSKFYCKYVIDIINNNLKKMKKNSDLYTALDEKLYESYLRLEKIINDEFKKF